MKRPSLRKITALALIGLAAIACSGTTPDVSAPPDTTEDPPEPEPPDPTDRPPDGMEAHTSQPPGPDCYVCHGPMEVPDTASPQDFPEDIIVTAGRRSSEAPFWNAWFEAGIRSRPSYGPQPVLAADSTYTMFLDLSGLKFDEEGVTSSPASPGAVTTMEESQGDELKLQVLTVTNPDRLRLARGESRVKTLTVDLIRYRNLKNLLEDKDSDVPVTEVDPLYSLGSASFQFDTRDRIGLTSIGLSIWANGVPVDEKEVPVCIGHPSDCEDEEVFSTSLSGLDSTELGLQLDNRAPPDGAIHFVDLWGSSVTGVFRCNTCEWASDRYVTWSLERSADQLREYLTDTIQPAFQNAAAANDTASFEAAGRDLYRVLLGRDDAAEEAFEDFFQISMASADVPSIFVRVLYDQSISPMLIPLGLVSVPTGDSSSDFIGNIFRVEAPLGYQNYAPQSGCLDSWSLLVPPRTNNQTPLDRARANMASWITAFSLWTSNASVYQDIPSFRTWLEAGNQPRDEADEEGIIILSHHEDNQLFFDEFVKTPNITSATVNRRFAGASLAIINACGAASPGASEFVDSFNRSGIATVVATSTTVNARMAGDFLNRFGNNIQENKGDPKYSIGFAVYDTVQDLTTDWGVYALIYGLYGNGNLKVCLPENPSM